MVKRIFVAAMVVIAAGFSSPVSNAAPPNVTAGSSEQTPAQQTVPGGNYFAAAKEESLSLGGKKTKSAPTPVEEPRVRRPSRPDATRIELKPAPGVTMEQAWNEFFADALKNPAEDDSKLAASVRQTVRELMQDKKHDEVLTVIQAALRNGHIQAWMYDTMSIALQIQKAPPEEIERALMSAVDFANSDTEIMTVAQYMASLGLHARALKLYQEVAAANPFAAEAYVSGLKSAQALRDMRGLQWACAGILSQAWPQEFRNVESKARRISEATLYDLRKRGKNQEADEFEAACKRALQRDCVAVIRWSGDADIDMAVAEPAGTICSVQSPRTIGGGVIVGDAFASKNSSAKGYAEAYVCPLGFDGEYRMLVKKVWGKVSAGLVTVDIYTHYGAMDQTHIHQNISVGEKDAVVIFDLKNGRRTDPLAEEQVTNVARNQMNVNRAVLAQQVGAASDSMSNPGIRDVAAAWKRGDNIGRFAVNRPNAVGFSPVIRAFPQGNQMTCMAIISADRRYVRFSLLGNQPIASGIGQVSTFNFVTGQGAVQGGGGGGAGGAGGQQQGAGGAGAGAGGGIAGGGAAGAAGGGGVM